MEWKTVIGNKHEVSRDGRVRNKKTKRELKADMSGGYKRVLIVVDGVRTHQAIHRLVATAFCENKNPQEFIYVNHIDENKLNNNADNLEWVSPSQNTSHGTARQRASLKTTPSTAGGPQRMPMCRSPSPLGLMAASCGTSPNMTAFAERKRLS